MAIYLGLLRDAVILQFEIKIFRAENLFEPINRLAGFRQLLPLDRFGYFARQAAGERDEPLFVGSQKFFIDARFVIVNFEMSRRGELDQITVTRFVFGEQNEMVVNIAS